MHRTEVVFELLHDDSLSGEMVLENLSGFPTKIKVGHYSASYKKKIVIIFKTKRLPNFPKTT